MSYHVTILRTAGRDRSAIGRDEVARLAASRSDLRLEDDSGRLLIHAATPGGAATLVLQRGEIWAKNPDRSTLALMLELAGELGARVRGDELETYRTPDDSYLHPDDREQLEESKRQVDRMRRRARWISRAWFVGALLVAAAVGLAVHRCTT